VTLSPVSPSPSVEGEGEEFIEEGLRPSWTLYLDEMNL